MLRAVWGTFGSTPDMSPTQAPTASGRVTCLIHSSKTSSSCTTHRLGLMPHSSRVAACNLPAATSAGAAAARVQPEDHNGVELAAWAAQAVGRFDVQVRQAGHLHCLAVMSSARHIVDRMQPAAHKPACANARDRHNLIKRTRVRASEQCAGRMCSAPGARQVEHACMLLSRMHMQQKAHKLLLGCQRSTPILPPKLGSAARLHCKNARLHCKCAPPQSRSPPHTLSLLLVCFRTETQFSS